MSSTAVDTPRQIQAKHTVLHTAVERPFSEYRMPIQPLSRTTIGELWACISRARFSPRGRKGAALDDSAVEEEPVIGGLCGAGQASAFMESFILHREKTRAHAPTFAHVAFACTAARPCSACVRLRCLTPALQPRRRFAAVVGACDVAVGVYAHKAAHTSFVAPCDCGSALEAAVPFMRASGAAASVEAAPTARMKPLWRLLAPPEESP